MKTKILIMLAAVALLAACKGKSHNGEYEVINNSADTATSYSESSDTAKVDIQPKLVKTSDLNMKVKNVRQTGDSVAALTARYKGMVTHHQMRSQVVNSQDIRTSADSVLRVSAFSTSADMQLRVPSEKLEPFIAEVGRLGIYVTGSTMDIEDKSLDYLSAKMKLDSRRELIAQQKKGKITIKDPEKVLWLKDDMIDGQINNQRIDNAVKYSNISLNFYQSNTIVKEMVANDDPSAYQLPFFNRLGLSMANGWVLFIDLVLGIANMWMLILVAIGLWIAFRAYKRKGAIAALKA